MKNYEDLDLRPLPEPWVWAKGRMDGDPVAVLRQDGWVVRLHEAEAGHYTDKLRITERRDPDSLVNDGPNFPAAIPFPVFEAVHRALREWYEVKEPGVYNPVQEIVAGLTLDEREYIRGNVTVDEHTAGSFKTKFAGLFVFTPDPRGGRDIITYSDLGFRVLREIGGTPESLRGVMKV